MAAPVPPSPVGPLPHAHEQEFQHVVAGVEDYAIYLLDASGRVTSWNAGAERMNGYRREEILGKHFSVFHTPEAAAAGRPEREVAEALASGHFADESWRVRKDGSRFWASVVLTPLWTAERSLRGFLKITRDLTERRLAEETLRQSEERFRLVVEQVQDYAIFMLDPEGMIVSWNAGAQRIKGYETSEIVGRPYSIFFPPEDARNGKPGWLLRTAAEQGRVEDEGWRVRKDGRQFWANAVLTALHDRDGRLRGYAKVTRDLTDRRQVEALQEADRQKNRFLALMAHELRNPLAPIRSALHIIGRPNASAREVERAREIAERQVKHMSRLLEDLLDVSRVGQGILELREEPVEMAGVVSRAAETVRPLIQERRHLLSISQPREPLVVTGDPTRLDQVVSNLLTNAAKYTDPGGEISVHLERQDGDAVLRVRDTGIGIDAAVLPTIFDPFVQAERRTESSAGGVGIGLTLVRSLVALHGGRVSAFSAGKGKGTEFVVRLPAAEAVPELEPPSRRPPARADAPLGALRVLVVDDNIDAAESLAGSLRMEGYTAAEAYGGEEALSAARTFRPDAILLDLGMPGMDGFEAARRLRADPQTRRTLLVAVTGWGQADDRIRTRDAGFDRHLVKPVDPGELHEILRAAGRPSR